MNTRDGLDTSDRATLLAGSHGHANWAFTAPGDYDLTFTASGTLAGGGDPVTSDPTTFRFTVVPEPGTTTLFLIGTGLLLGLPRRGA
jgi:surface-anchored protein